MTHTPDPRPSSLLSAAECWTRLRRHHEGRLSYASGRGPRHVVLPYAVEDGEVLVRVPAYCEAAQQAADLLVSFDVVEEVAPGTAERVEVRGRARLDPPGDARPDGPRGADPPGRLVRLRVEDVRGETSTVGRPQVPADC